MCMEDVRIGRRSPTAETVVLVNNATPVEIAPASPTRTCLTIGGCETNVLTVSTNPAVIAGQGFNIGAGTKPVELNIRDIGGAVQKAWFGITNTGADATFVVQTLTPEQ